MAQPHILVVDDHPAITRMLALVLGRAGYLVSCAASGPQALERFRSDAPDLVLLDLNLPEIPGWEVCRQMKAARPVPIIIITGQAPTEIHAYQRAPEADAYVLKPFDMAELLDQIQVILQQTPPIAAR